MIQNKIHLAKGVNTSPWLRRLPNQLTWLRILSIPLVVVLMLQAPSLVDEPGRTLYKSDFYAGLVFTLAAVTDFFDGWLARKYGSESVLGKLLDPLADKLLVVSALVILVERHRLAGWIAVILIVRDLGINAIRIASLEDNITIPSNWLGKTKTVFLYIGIVGLTIYGDLFGLGFDWFTAQAIGQTAMWFALATSVISAAQYLWDYAKILRSQSKN